MAPWYKRLKRFVRYPFVLAAFGIASALPLRLALWLGGLLGQLAFRVLPSQRNLALAHLAQAFPDKTASERRVLAKECFVELGRVGLEACQARKLDPRIKDYVDWPAADIAQIRNGLAEGKGGIFVTGHIGNWELLARRIVAEGFDHAVVVREPGDARLAGLVARFREAGGVHTVGRGTGMAPLREMLSAFKRGALLGLLIDQDTRVQGLQVPFFGRLAHTPRAAEDLAVRTGAPLFVGFIHRLPEGGHVLRTERVDVGADRPEGQLTAGLTARIEAEIREHPADWVWMHRRWHRSAVPLQAPENVVPI